MKGKHHIIISNNRIRYEFDVRRNITVIRGDSGTGKTTLINMLRQYQNLGTDSGIDLSCDVPCKVLEGSDWKLRLTGITKSILFIDEENRFIVSEEFAHEVQNSDNYFVIITRENLYNLPYSVEEIYGIHNSGKYNDTRKTYQEIYQLYSADQVNHVNPTRLVIEDSNAGYDFFKAVAELHHIQCDQAGGKSNIYKLIEDDTNNEVCVIADGAAIGPEMSNLHAIIVRNPNIKLYLPESFEWMILKSGLIDDNEIQEVLDSPEDYVDSVKFLSWERFFTNLLVEKSKDSYLQYSKSKLNANYLHEKEIRAIVAVAKAIEFKDNN